MKKWLIAIFTILIICGIRYSDPWILEAIRMKALDVHQQTQKTKILEDIITVEIDNKTMDKNGQWPWPREIMQRELIRLFESGAGMVVMPILFSQPDRDGKDQKFADILAQVPVVIGQIPASEAKGNPVPRGVATIGLNWQPWVYKYDSAVGPVKIIGNAATGVGMMNTTPESDGVVRRLPLVVQIDGKLYPSISLETLRVVAGDPSYQMKTGDAGVEALRIPKFSKIITDSTGSIWIDFQYKTKTYSLTDTLPDLKGKIIILSPTASGIDNPVATPIGVIPGHDLIATSIGTMMTGTNISRPWWANFLEIGSVLILGSILAIIVLTLPWVVSLISPIVIVSTYFVSSFLFTKYGYLVDWSYPALGIFVAWSIAAFLRFIAEFKLRQQIKKQFEHYLAPEMVKKLQQNPELLRLGGDTREMTFLFTDIRGFTPISEQYKTNPQGLTALINRFLTPMTWTIMNNYGTIDKYMGDCIMAFWNAPLDVPDQRKKAVGTSLEMLSKLESLNKELAQENLLPINVGIGINTGSCVVGNMGSDQRFDYSVIGDAVNLAARLEGQSKEYGVKIILGEETVKDIEDEYFCLELDSIAVKGKTEPVRIFTVLGENKWVFENTNWCFSQQQHEKFLTLYRNQNWAMAKHFLLDLRGEFNKLMVGYYDMMFDRIERLEFEDLPDDWDGINIATTK